MVNYSSCLIFYKVINPAGTLGFQIYQIYMGLLHVRLDRSQVFWLNQIRDTGQYLCLYLNATQAIKFTCKKIDKLIIKYVLVMKHFRI